MSCGNHCSHDHHHQHGQTEELDYHNLPERDLEDFEESSILKELPLGIKKEII